MRKKIITIVIITVLIMYARGKIIEANTPTDNGYPSQLSDGLTQEIENLKETSGEKALGLVDEILYKMHLMNKEEAVRLGLDTDGTYQQAQKVSTWISEILAGYFGREKTSSPVQTMEIEQTDIVFNDILEKVALIRVVDGDTIVVQRIVGGVPVEVRVRLIGLDTPESVHEDETRNNEWGQKASKHTKELLKDVSNVYLQYDQSKNDPYGRELCYVWLSDNIDVDNMQDVANKMLNAIIIRDGYAKDKVFLPNTAYADIFAQLCEEAKESLAGLWSEDGFVKLWE